MHLSKFAALSSLSFVFVYSSANSTNSDSTSAFLSQQPHYRGRITGQFLAGNQQQLGGFTDALIPLLQRKGQLFFADGTMMVGQSQRRMISAGFGYRGIQPFFNRSIIGAYVFGDYYKTRLNNKAWQLNPGLEWLCERYEVRLQGYVPLGRKQQSYASTLASAIPAEVLADSSHNPNKLSGAVGHRLIDTPVSLMEEFGQGVELEAGYFLDYAHSTWLRLGGYHYHYANSKDINGIEANIQIAVNNRVSLLLQDNYDNQNKNRFAIGLRVSIGGADASLPGLGKRMTAPIIRHLARQSYGEAAPTRQNFKQNAPTIVKLDNIWFFGQTGSGKFMTKESHSQDRGITKQSCTAENPCVTLDSHTAEQIAALAPDAKLFLETGQYFIPQDSDQWLSLQDGQSLWGRNTGWLTAAGGDNRPVIHGGVIWGNQEAATIANGSAFNIQVNNSNQVLPASVFNYQGKDAAFGLAATGNLVIHDSTVQVTSNKVNTNAVAIAAGKNAQVQRSNVLTMTQGLGNNADLSSDAIGIYANQQAYVDKTIVNVRSSGHVNDGGVARAFGVKANQITIRDSEVATATTGRVKNGGNVSSWGVSGNHTALIESSTISSKTNGGIDSGGEAQARGIETNNELTLKNSTVEAESTGSVTNEGHVSSWGVSGSESTDVTIESSTISSKTNGSIDSGGEAKAQGIEANNELTLKHSIVNAETTGSVKNEGHVNSWGVSGNHTALIESSTINSKTNGSIDSGGEAQAQGIEANNELTLKHSIVNAETTGSVKNEGHVNSWGVSGNATTLIESSAISSKTNGSIDSGGEAQAQGIEANNELTLKHSIVNAETTGDVKNEGHVNSWGVSGNHTALIESSTISSKTNGSIDSGGEAQAQGIEANNELTLKHSIVKAETTGSVKSGGHVNSWGVNGSGSTNATVESSTISSKTNGSIDSGGQAEARGVEANQTTITDSTVMAETTGNFNNGGRVNAWGVHLAGAGNSATVVSSTICSKTNGSIGGGGQAQARGVEANQTIITDSTVTAETIGNVHNGGDVNAWGLHPEGAGNSATVESSTISSKTNGNVTWGAGGMAQARGVESNQTTITDSTVTAETTGDINSGGNVNAWGLDPEGAGSSATVESSTISSKTSGSIDGGGQAEARGVEANQTIITDSTVTAETTGSVKDNGSVNAWGLDPEDGGNSATVESSTISSSTSGNIDGGGEAKSRAIQSAAITIKESVLSSKTFGETDQDQDSVGAIGLRGSGYKRFEGDGASELTVESKHGSEFFAEEGNPIENNSNPKSLCNGSEDCSDS